MKSLSVVILDPSHFTFPYDHHLAQALARRGHSVHFIGRAFRINEERPHSLYNHYPHFYLISERLQSILGKNLFVTIVKGCEHVVNLVQVVVRIKKMQSDIVHMQWSPFPLVDLLSVVLLAPLPVIFTIHDSNLFQGEPTSRLQKIGYGKFINHVAAVIAHTNFSKKGY